MKTDITTPRIPSGFNEYLPAEQIEFNRLLGIIQSTYERYGFVPLDTPILELSEVLLAKGGGETEQQIYRFERGKNDLSMRFDLTVPLARYVAQHEGVLSFPFRRYQIGKVFRAERAQAGRFREFYQCDIDTIGSTSPIVDAEFPAVINDIFDAFNIGEFTIRINNRMILNGFYEQLGLSALAPDILRVVDKLEKLRRPEIEAELTKLGVSPAQTDAILAFSNIAGANSEVLARLDAMDNQTTQFKDGVAKLRHVIEALRMMNVPEHRVKIDLKIARGLDYYTGTVYETVLDDYPEIGSVCSGGRYDNLASNYTKTAMPGVGISIGLTRLFYKLVEAGVVTPRQQSMAEIIIIPVSEVETPRVVQLAAALRACKHAVLVNTESNNLGKKLRYADKLGCTYAIIIGEDEVATGKLTVKTLSSGDTAQCTLDEFMSRLD